MILRQIRRFQGLDTLGATPYYAFFHFPYTNQSLRRQNQFKYHMSKSTKQLVKLLSISIASKSTFKVRHAAGKVDDT